MLRGAHLLNNEPRTENYRNSLNALRNQITPNFWELTKFQSNLKSVITGINSINVFSPDNFATPFLDLAFRFQALYIIAI